MNCPNCNFEKYFGDFCVKCGKNLNKKKIQPNFISRTIYSTIIIFLLISTLIYGFTMLLEKVLNPENTLEQMNEAYILKNEDEFSSYFLTDKSAYSDSIAFYNYIDSIGWPLIYKQLKKEVATKSQNPLETIYDKAGNKLISIVHRPFIFGHFSKSIFYIHPVQIELNEKNEYEKLYLVNKKNLHNVQIKNTMKIVPGIYDLSLQNENLHFTDSKSLLKRLVLEGEGKNYQRIDTGVYSKKVIVQTNLLGASLIVDGVNIGVFNGTNFDLGNVFINKDVEVQARMMFDSNQWNSEISNLSSEMIQVNFSEEVVQKYKNYLIQKEYEKNQKVEEERIKQLTEKSKMYEEEINMFIQEFRENYELALNNGEFGYVEDYFNSSLVISEVYRKEVQSVKNIPYYNYTFLTNDLTKLEAMDEDIFIAYTTETFEFVSESEALSIKKMKKYKIKLDSGYMFTINEIEQISNEEKSISQ